MNAPVTKFIEIPKGHLFTPEEAARRKMWAQYFVGIFGVIVAALLIVVGVPAGLWWLFHHVSFH